MPLLLQELRKPLARSPKLVRVVRSARAARAEWIANAGTPPRAEVVGGPSPVQVPVQDEKWSGGLTAEIMFWAEFFATEGSRYVDDYNQRLNPKTPLQDTPRSLIDVPPGGTLRLLDVGAGPMTFFGKVWDGRTVDITAVDALADEYDRIMAENGIEPLVRTRLCHSERLNELFEPGSFDLVCASNTLDHSYDPLEAIRQMVDLTRPGGAVYLRHMQNEAEHEQYTGLHQWNLMVEDGRLIVWNPDERHDVEDVLAGAAKIELAEIGDERWHEVALRK